MPLEKKFIMTASEFAQEQRSRPPARSSIHNKLAPCPECKAPAGAQCVNKKGKELPGTAVHASRIGAAPKRNTSHF